MLLVLLVLLVLFLCLAAYAAYAACDRSPMPMVDAEVQLTRSRALVRVCVCVCVYVRARVCVRACCVPACVCGACGDGGSQDCAISPDNARSTIGGSVQSLPARVLTSLTGTRPQPDVIFDDNARSADAAIVDVCRGE